MTVTTLDGLARIVDTETSGASAKQALERAGRLREVRISYEAGDAVYEMFTISRLSQMLEGFPRYVEDLDLRFDGDIWRSEARPSVGRRFMVRQERIVHAALPSMGIGQVEGAVETVIRMVGWKLDTLGEDLVRAAAALPDHTDDAFFGRGLVDIAAMVGCGLEDLPVEQIAMAAKRLCVNFTKPRAGGRHLLENLTHPSCLPYLKALIDIGIKPNASTLIASAEHCDTGVFDTLVATGLSVNCVDELRGSALHVAARNAGVAHSSTEAVAFAHDLLRRGIDIGIRDMNGRTAAALLQERIDGIYGMGEDHRYDMMLLEELFGFMKPKAE